MVQDLLMLSNVLYLFVILQVVLPEILGRHLAPPIEPDQSEFDFRIDIPKWDALERRIFYVVAPLTVIVAVAVVLTLGDSLPKNLGRGMTTLLCITGVLAVVISFLFTRRIFWNRPKERSSS